LYRLYRLYWPLSRIERWKANTADGDRSFKTAMTPHAGLQFATTVLTVGIVPFPQCDHPGGLMSVSKVLLSPDIERELGQDGVAEVAASLWAVDCQTCGRSLGTRPPSLCVDDLRMFAMATLHHERCRAPAWNQGSITGQGGAYVSHRTRLVMLPLSDLTGTEGSLNSIPVMLVNPSMENVILTQDDGKWHPQMHAVFGAMGMVPPGPGLRLYKPINGATARLTATAVTITMQQPAPSDTYTCGLTANDASFAREIADQRGILLAATYDVDPDAGDVDLTRQFQSALRDGRLLCGWVPLSAR
jgi:hypothetical protein